MISAKNIGSQYQHILLSSCSRWFNSMSKERSYLMIFRSHWLKTVYSLCLVLLRRMNNQLPKFLARLLPCNKLSFRSATKWISTSRTTSRKPRSATPSSNSIWRRARWARICPSFCSHGRRSNRSTTLSCKRATSSRRCTMPRRPHSASKSSKCSRSRLRLWARALTASRCIKHRSSWTINMTRATLRRWFRRLKPWPA